MAKRTVPAAFFLAALVLSSISARADECAVPDGANARLASVSPAARLAFLREALNHDARNAQIWKWVWTGVYVAGGAGELGLTAILPAADRNQYYVGAVESGIAALPLVVLPLMVGTDGPTFDAQVASSTNPAETCTLIRLGEMLVVRDAANERDGTSWIMQVVNVLYNVAFSAILGWGFHYKWTTDLVSGVIGTAIGEGMILTQPMHLNDAWKAYQTGTFGKDGGSGDGFPKVMFGPPPGTVAGITVQF